MAKRPMTKEESDQYERAMLDHANEPDDPDEVREDELEHAEKRGQISGLYLGVLLVLAVLAAIKFFG